MLVLVEGALLHLSPVQGLLGGGRNVRSDLCSWLRGEDPSVPPQSSCLPQVLSRGVGGHWDPKVDRGGTSLAQLYSQVTQAQDGELGGA